VRAPPTSSLENAALSRDAATGEKYEG